MSMSKRKAKYAIGSWQNDAQNDYENNKYSMSRRKEEEKKAYEEKMAAEEGKAEAEEEDDAEDEEEDEEEDKNKTSTWAKTAIALAGGLAAYRGAKDREKRPRPGVRMGK